MALPTFLAALACIYLGGFTTAVDNIDQMMYSELMDKCNDGEFEVINKELSANRTGSNYVNGTDTGNFTQSLDLKFLCASLLKDYIPPLDENEILLKALQYYLTGIAGFIVCILGCVGNGLSIAILRSKMYTSSTNVYLLALAASDICLLVCAMLLCLCDIFNEVQPDFRKLSNIRGYTLPFVNPLVNVFQTTSIWLVVAFTIDRYIMICHPFQGAKFCNRKRAITVVSCLYVLGLLYNIPKFFELETVGQLDENGRKDVTVDLTDFGENRIYKTIVHLGSYLVFIFVLPCLTLAALNYQLIVAVRQSRSKGRRLSLGTTCNHRNDTTLMLVAVVVVFLVCQLPALISNTIYASMTDNFIRGPARSDYLQIIAEIANFLVILNSAINILLYYVFSPKFRTAFLIMFLKPCLQRSKVLVSALSRQFSGRSNDTATSTELSTKGFVCDMTNHACPAVRHDDDSLTTHKHTSVSFGTMISCDGISLITASEAQKLSLSFQGDSTKGPCRSKSENSGLGPVNV